MMPGSCSWMSTTSTIMAGEKIIDVTHVSARGTSYRITIPRKIAKRLGLEDGDILKFTDDNGVKISKLE